MLKEAVELLNKGYSVVACRKDDKRPVSNWKEFQQRLPTMEELQEWFKRDPNTNIGMITGSISGFFVIDIDKGTDMDTLFQYKDFPPTLTVKTGNGGYHYYYLIPAGVTVPTKARIFGETSKWKVDVRGEGGFIVCPPSIHPVTGVAYEYIEKTDIAPCPQWILKEWENAREINSDSPKQWESAAEGSGRGSRNVNMTSYAGYLMKKLSPKVWDDAIPAAMIRINKKNNPALPEKELEIIYNSIKKKELLRRKADNEPDEEIEEIKHNAPKSLHALYNQDIPPTMWMVDRLIPINGITVLAAASGSFKTWLLLEIALRIAAKQKVFEEFDVLQDDFGILIVDEENWEGIIQSRLKLLIEENLVPSLEKFSIFFYNLELLKIVKEENLSHIISVCREKNVKFIIFDSLNRIHNADENSATEMNKVFNQMKKLQKEGLTILFTHHNRKQGIFKPADPAENMRGSGDIKASVDCQLAVEIKMLDEEKTLVIHQFKARTQEELASFKVKIIKDENYIHFKHAGAYEAADDKNSKIKHYKPEIMAFIEQNPGAASMELISNFDKKLSPAYLREALKQLEKDMILKTEGKKPKKYFINAQIADDISAGGIFEGREDPVQGELLD